MNNQHIKVVAKQIASVLAENEATVNDMYAIFQLVKDNLIVTAATPFAPGYSYGHEIRVTDLPNDGDRIGDEEFE